MLEKLRDWESLNAKLKNELEDASHQLIVNGSDLANSKLELQRHRNEIDVRKWPWRNRANGIFYKVFFFLIYLQQRLNVDICNLSTLCSQHTTKSNQHDDILRALKGWQENRDVPETELVTHIITACQEVWSDRTIWE